MVKIKIVNESEHNVPKYATEGSAGMDLYANIPQPILIHPMETIVIPTGIRIELPIGYEAQVRPRSGLAAKYGITVLNSPGTVDSDFRGIVGVILINLSNKVFEIKDGDRIAQMVIAKYETAEFIECESLEETERGEGGFGHTGVNESIDKKFIPAPPKEGWSINPNPKIVESISKRIVRNDGECPCSNPGKTHEDRMCPCLEYRENGICHCSLYVKNN